VAAVVWPLAVSTTATCVVLLYAETNQIEDPRLKWREEQERMLKEYLEDASQDLAVSELAVCISSLQFVDLY